MPQTTTATHNGHTITFTEQDHRYVDEQGHEYTSVTTLVKRHFPRFDPIVVSERMQAQGKGDAATLRAQWAAKSDASCRFGTRCHEVAEDTLLNRPQRNTPADSRERSAFRAVWEFCTTRLMGTGIGKPSPELLVFSPRLYVAGTVDLLIEIRDDLWILDWKTNETIKRTGFRGESALAPIANLPACDWSKYGLQLGIYERLLRDEGYTPAGARIRRGLLHVNQPSPEQAFAVDILELPPLDLEVANVLLANATDVPF